ncbi:MAG: 50S ribosomal protein L21 [Candidatus Omnitrophota bacterium]
MYAVVETGGKQYKINENDVIDVELILSPEGEKITLDKVLLACEADKVLIGKPFLKDAHVICHKVGTVKSKKSIIFKFRRRKASKKKTGHRQHLLRLRIEKIVIP